MAKHLAVHIILLYRGGMEEKKKKEQRRKEISRARLCCPSITPSPFFPLKNLPFHLYIHTDQDVWWG